MESNLHLQTTTTTTTTTVSTTTKTPALSLFDQLKNSEIFDHVANYKGELPSPTPSATDESVTASESSQPAETPSDCESKISMQKQPRTTATELLPEPQQYNKSNNINEKTGTICKQAQTAQGQPLGHQQNYLSATNKNCSDHHDSMETSMERKIGTPPHCIESIETHTANEDITDKPILPHGVAWNINTECESSNGCLMAPQPEDLDYMTPTATALTVNAAATSKMNQDQLKPNVLSSSHTQSPGVPSLQWPWNRCSSTLTPNLQVTTNAPHKVSTTASKKRVASISSNSETTSGVKKRRGSNNNSGFNQNVPSGETTASGIPSSNNNKRLKIAAMEETQTKITGYFKTQMKSQGQSLVTDKKYDPDPRLQSPTNNSSSISLPAATASINQMSSSSTVAGDNNTSTFTMSTPATTASLNKYFNMLSQLTEQKKVPSIKCAESVASNPPSTSETEGSSTGANHASNSSSTTAITSTSAPMPVPALKKIERSTKPAKVAQVAPNLRRSSTQPSQQQLNHSILAKSPTKKHVAIAPRMPDMKSASTQNLQKQGHQQMVSKQVPNTLTTTAPQAPAVLVTAIRLPPHNSSINNANKPPNPKLIATSMSNNVIHNAATVTTTVSPTIYQLPMHLPNLMQLPHLGQLPQLLATNNSLVQLNSAVKNSATVASTTGTATAQAAQAAAAQYYLNGTIFKLQQFTTATTTTATTATAATPTNPLGFVNINELQEFLLKQQQLQKPANLQDILQQQMAAALAQQQQFQQFQSLNANIHQQQHQQQVFMATPTGLLVNTSSLPGVLAQAATLALNNQQQKVTALTMQQQPQQQALPALHPIPALSSIFTTNGANTSSPPTPQPQSEQQDQVHQFTQQQQHQLAQFLISQQNVQQHQQFITANHPPPLAVVPTTSTTAAPNINNTSSTAVACSGNTVSTSSKSNTAKLAIVKAATNSSSSGHKTLSSQPPPLVTISNSKARLHMPPIGSVIKGAAGLKSCQKRNIRLTGKSTKPKTTNAKIRATPTTPPPLVPASSNTAAKELSELRVVVTAKPINISGLPTPALVSIAPAKLTPTLSMVSNSTKNISVSGDIFDFIKNSQNTGNSSAATNFHSSDGDIAVVKSEPIDDRQSFPEQRVSSSIMSSQSIDMVSSFSGCIPCLQPIKNELIEESTTASNSSHLMHTKTPPPTPFNSFSAHSNSDTISSNADLSLEASTPACMSSSLPSIPSSPTPSNSIGSYSNSSSSNKAIRAASQTDILSEMAASNNTSSSSSSSSSMSEETHLKMAKSLRRTKSFSDEEDEEKRNLPSPESESGIGGSGSLSNSELSSSTEIPTIEKSGGSDDGSTMEGSPDSNVPSPESATMQTEESQSMLNMTNNSSSSETTVNLSTEVENDTLSSLKNSTTLDIQLVECDSTILPKCAISPILSQPKTIRFPADDRYSGKSMRRHHGVCYWDKCNQKHSSSSKLLDHMQTQHVNMQIGPFVCLWDGCKVYNKQSCSRRWLERHVLSHGGAKQFKCIVEGCGLRFASQLALQKHVNNHFNEAENKESATKRTSDPPVPKQLRINGKKLRYRRQPFSARRFDFFDGGMMEGLEHRLRQANTLLGDNNSITFYGEVIMERLRNNGKSECLVRWSPSEIIDDEWVPMSTEEKYVKAVRLVDLGFHGRARVESLLKISYMLPYDPNLFSDKSDLDDTSSCCNKDSGKLRISKYHRLLTLAKEHERRHHDNQRKSCKQSLKG